MMAQQQSPVVSIIVPVHNAADTLNECLRSLLDSDYPHIEVLVADDGSTDCSPALTRRFPVRLIRAKQRRGPAAARNRAAEHAVGEILAFVDSDVVVRRNTISGLVRSLQDGAAAAVGRYDEDARFPNFASRYKNLWLCHMFHQAPQRIDWFWTGCGAVRRDDFDRAGGFDEELLQCEDYALGYSLSKRGARIRLDHSIRVTHRHVRTWRAVLASDFRRSRNNVKLLLSASRGGDSSFATARTAWSVAAVHAMLLALFLSWQAPAALVAAPLFLLLFAGANRSFFRFLRQHASRRFALSSLGMTLAVHFTAGLGALAGAGAWLLSRGPGLAPPGRIIQRAPERMRR